MYEKDILVRNLIALEILPHAPKCLACIGCIQRYAIAQKNSSMASRTCSLWGSIALQYIIINEDNTVVLVKLLPICCI